MTIACRVTVSSNQEVIDMANVLRVAMQQSIKLLLGLGYSRCHIAREPGVSRETVRRYMRLLASRGAPSDQAISTAGPAGRHGS